MTTKTTKKTTKKAVSKMTRAKLMYAKLMAKSNFKNRPERQDVLKVLISKRFKMEAKGASSYYGTLKDIAVKDLKALVA